MRSQRLKEEIAQQKTNNVHLMNDIVSLTKNRDLMQNENVILIKKQLDYEIKISENSSLTQLCSELRNDLSTIRTDLILTQLRFDDVQKENSQLRGGMNAKNELLVKHDFEMQNLINEVEKKIERDEEIIKMKSLMDKFNKELREERIGKKYSNTPKEV